MQKTKILAIITLSLIVLIFVSYLLIYYKSYRDLNLITQNKYKSHIDSVYKNDPKKLHQNLIESFKKDANENDKKFYLYWLFHRYYDNDLNIKETFDLIENNPELSFLKEAEKFYPEMFLKLRNNQELLRFEKDLINLSYGEIMVKNQYYDISLVGSMSNDYLSLSLKMPEELKDVYIKKSLTYYKYMIDGIKAGNYTKENINTANNIDIRNLLVGLNKYILLDTAMEFLNIKRETLDTEEIYLIAKSLISQNYKELEKLESVTDLFFAMNISIKNDTNMLSIYKIDNLLSGTMKKNNRNGDAIISKNANNVIYSEEIIRSLMNNSTIFKKWLISKNPDWRI